MVLDIIVAWMARWIVILWRDLMSYRRPAVSGSIVRSHLEKPGFGCMYVAIECKYKANFERSQGAFNKPYAYSDNYAEAFVRHHSPGCELRVRVDPKDHLRSFPVFD